MPHRSREGRNGAAGDVQEPLRTEGSRDGPQGWDVRTARGGTVPSLLEEMEVVRSPRRQSKSTTQGRCSTSHVSYGRRLYPYLTYSQNTQGRGKCLSRL